jgi:hypothetical protein
MQARTYYLSLVLILAFMLTGCALSAPEPTATPVPPTFTPVPPTETPIPTATATNTPTLTPTSTPDAKATQAAVATAAAAESIAKIDSILKEYDLSTDEGQFGEYITKPAKITAVTYDAMIFDPLSTGSYTDFAFYTEIAWTSTSGLAGCGVIFRSEDTKLEKDFYRFNTLRLSGAPAWDVEYYADGDFKSNATGKVKFSNTINVGNGDNNAYLLVVKDKTLTVYANGKKLSQVDITQRVDGGPFLVFTFQESGETTCTFTNSWVWKYK